MIVIRKAMEKDIEKIIEITGQAQLSTAGIGTESVENFLLMENENRVIHGFIGLEFEKNAALLRTLVILNPADQPYIIEMLKAGIEYSRAKKVSKLFLCTNQETAVDFFAMIGFERLQEKPEALEHFRHYQNIKRDEPTVMQYILK